MYHKNAKCQMIRSFITTCGKNSSKSCLKFSSQPHFLRLSNSFKCAVTTLRSYNISQLTFYSLKFKCLLHNKAVPKPML